MDSSASSKLVFLALSTFRQSDALITNTIRLAKEKGQELFVGFVVDVNLERYTFDAELPKGSQLEYEAKEEILGVFEEKAERKMADILGLAEEQGVTVEGQVIVGRFGIEMLRLIQEKKPSIVTLTRSNRPKWVLQIFGSPVDYIIEHADCAVIEDYGITDEAKEESEAPRNWWSALFSFKRTQGHMRYGLVVTAVVFFILMVLTPPPESLVQMMREKSPLGYFLQSGTGTICESVNKVMGQELTPEQVAQKAKIMIAILFAAALLWATEAIPLGATDILVGALLYLFSILPLDAISKAYMKDAVFFIFGVLAIAVGVSKTGLDRRISLVLLGKVRGLGSFCFIFLPLLAVAAGFLSEHALVAILIPVLLRYYRTLCDKYNIRSNRGLAVLFLLGICFAANQGGPGSPAAGGRNAVMVGYLKDYNMPISFGEWMYSAFPFVLVISVVIGAYLYFAFRKQIRIPNIDLGAVVREEIRKAPRMSQKEVVMGLILALVVVLWIVTSKRFGLGGPCMFAVVLMIVFNIVDWKDIQSRVRFDVVGLYAAACAMGVGLKITGGALWLARVCINALPESLQQGNALIIMTSFLTGIMTNFMSDGATVAAIGPVVLSMASVSQIHLWKLGLACAFSSSFANILIIGTPNNAIAYASGVDPKTGARLLTLRDFIVYGIPVTILAWIVLWLWTILGYWNWMHWP